MPWCIKKCPYCDFNSHQRQADLPEKAYIEALIDDLKTDIAAFGERPLSSIFIGGGTPSLFSGHSYQVLLQAIHDLLPTAATLEITLEANPGAVDQVRFESYLAAGINRLSLGVQSFDLETLKRLGRIHNAQDALQAIHLAKTMGFHNINLDLMYACPQQSIALGLRDLETAIAAQPTHLSWYQFTLEPNTYFYRHPPALPTEETLCNLEEAGLQYLATHGYERYEISAFHTGHSPCQHNLNYWRFGDYYGIGAGAHGKLTHPDTHIITRTQKHRVPRHYLNLDHPYLVEQTALSNPDKCFEFMLNAARLEGPIAFEWFTKTTHLPIHRLRQTLDLAQTKGLVTIQDNYWQLTPHGRRYTNDLQLMFLAS